MKRYIVELQDGLWVGKKALRRVAVRDRGLATAFSRQHATRSARRWRVLANYPSARVVEIEVGE